MTVRVDVRMTVGAVERIDAARGDLTRGEYIRRLVEARHSDEEVQHLRPSPEPVERPVEPVKKTDRHFHRPKEPVRTEWRQGKEAKIYRCGCGEEVERA